MTSIVTEEQRFKNGRYENREQGAGNDHKERENKKMGTIHNLNPALFPFSFHFHVSRARSPLFVPRFSYILNKSWDISQSEIEGNISPFLIESNPLNDSLQPAGADKI